MTLLKYLFERIISGKLEGEINCNASIASYIVNVQNAQV